MLGRAGASSTRREGVGSGSYARHMQACASLDRLAAEIAADLGKVEGVDAVHLYGSVARGEASVGSDIDLLVIVAERGVSRVVIGECRSYDRLRVRANVQSWQQLKSQRLDWSFLRHLTAEGRTLHGDPRQVREALSRQHPTDRDIRRQIAGHASFLERFDDLDIYAGRFFFSAAHLYRVAKSVVILGNARARLYEFDRGRAFLRFKRRHPRATDSVATVYRLEPYYLCADGRPGGGDGLEDPSEHTIRDAVASVSHLIRVAAE
jgi:predicted nucleotidyltransferase